MKTVINTLTLLAILAIAATAVILPLVQLQKRQQKRKALRDYVRRVGRVLRARHGKQPSYEPRQVQQMLEKWGYSGPYSYYCLALYCDQPSFDRYYCDSGKNHNYQTLRQEMCSYLPALEGSFDAGDVIDLGDRINHNPQSGDYGDYIDNDNASDFITSDSGSDYSGSDYSGSDYSGSDYSDINYD
jgi:type II secretory pathway pseudopilin PulG